MLRSLYIRFVARERHRGRRECEREIKALVSGVPTWGIELPLLRGNRGEIYVYLIPREI